MLLAKTILVCGSGTASSTAPLGIGAYVAYELARRGAHVICSSRSHSCEHLASTLTKQGYTASALVLDYTHGELVEAVLSKLVRDHPELNAVVNAGVHSALPVGFEKLTFSKWTESMDANLHSQYHLLRALVPHFEKHHDGHIVYCSTIATNMGLGMGKQRHGYAAGKAAATTLTLGVGIEYAKQGIRANVLEVGYVDSPLVHRAVRRAQGDLEEVTRRRDSYVPSGKQGNSLDVARAATFLLTEDARFINSTVLKCDGGTHRVAFGP